jgi:hypothetical protein
MAAKVILLDRYLRSSAQTEHARGLLRQSRVVR